MKRKLPFTMNKNAASETFIHTEQRFTSWQVTSSDKESEASTPLETAGKSFFGNLLGEARTGGRDFVSPGEKKKDQQKKDEYERAHWRPGQIRTPTREWQDMRQLPSVQMLEHLGNALNDGTAYQKSSTYRPESPLLQDQFYPDNGLQYENSSQVSFCQHQDLCIEWNSLDPDNKNGTWKPRMKSYFKSPLDHEDHKSCPAPDYQTRGKILAERIIQKFLDMENGKLTARDRRDGKEPRRPPPNNRVEREIQCMISQMSRGKHEKIVEQREATRVLMNAQDRKKELDTMVLQQAQQEVHRGQRAKGITVDDSEDDEAPLTKPKKLRVNTKSTSLAKRSTKDEKKSPMTKRTKTPLKPRKAKTTGAESDEDGHVVPKKVTSVRPIHRRLVSEQSSDEEEQPKATPKTKTTVKQPQAPKASRKPKPREMTTEERTLLAGIHQVEEEETEHYAAVEVNEEPQSESPEADNKDEDDELRSVLAAIERPNMVTGVTHPQQASVTETATIKRATNEKDIEEVEESWSFFKAARAEVQGQEQADDEEDQAFTQPSETSATPEADEVAHQAPLKKPEQTKSKKRKAAVIEEDMSEKQSQKKSKKSAAIITDSDDDADYTLPAAATKLPEEMVCEGWEAEGAALVEEVVHQQEKEEEQEQEQKETAEENEVTETIETQETIDITDTMEKIATTQIIGVDHTTQLDETEPSAEDTSTLPSPSKKRKRSSTPEQIPEVSSSKELDTNAQPAKKLKSSPAEEEITVIQEEVTRPSTPQPSSSVPPSPSSTPSPLKSTKRKNVFSDSMAEEEDSSVTSSTPSRLVEKVKRVAFSPEVTSPCGRERKMSIPYMVDVEGDAGVVNGEVDNTALSEDDEDGLDELFLE
ncbi:uncharacterized protein K460DRAFT_350954 [Cucurbitaria berberidis CBS 394.84]|uniref:Uncharacterized protein n=1 Tax=Cucurbitaria berberidis CBS 394.84 TaxID=1168544 RepID=A0A9P4LEC5_9PLEO|nr:uncharacterized protein K460DRAFT_350954 [Cucurbitaria berberidis CBS 394.84]KAF1850969.1 hypothetical protein K460DRAFT_350954 [Cucurbitaria berberidis CBS 394.84]